MKRLAVFIIFTLFLLLPLHVHGGETETGFELSLSGDTAKRGEIIKVYLDIKSNVGAFLAKVDYDNTVLQYINTESSSKGYAETYDDGASTASVFTLKSGGDGNAFIWSYKVKGDTPVEMTTITVNLSQIADTAGGKYMEDMDLSAELMIQPEPSDEAALLELAPSSGSLNEAFAPDVFEYTMSVPYEIKQMEFTWRCSEGAAASVNRKNLGSGGSVNRFTIVVTAPDKVTKSAYTIDVTRGTYIRESIGQPTPHKGGTSSGSSSKGSTAGPKSSSSAKSGTAAAKSASSKASKNSSKDENMDNFSRGYDENTETAPLVMNSESLIPFIAGVGSGIAAIAVGVVITIIIMRGQPYKTKHSSDNNTDNHDEK